MNKKMNQLLRMPHNTPSKWWCYITQIARLVFFHAIDCYLSCIVFISSFCMFLYVGLLKMLLFPLLFRVPVSALESHWFELSMMCLCAYVLLCQSNKYDMRYEIWLRPCTAKKHIKPLLGNKYNVYILTGRGQMAEISLLLWRNES